MQETIDSAIEAILKGGAQKSAPSRRAFPRYSASYPILIEPDRPPSEPTTGVTVNMARSGLLARVEAPIAPGSGCSITFLPQDHYRPELIECPHCGSKFPVLELPEEPIRGTVVRAERDDDAVFVAIMFATPLDAVGDGDDAEREDQGASGG